MRQVLFLLAAAALSASCSGGVTTTSLYSISTDTTDTTAVFERASRVAQRAGYYPVIVQPRRYRFAVHARYHDRFGPYLITVEVYRGMILVEPIGPRVETYQGETYLPVVLRDEVEALSARIHDVVRARR